MLDVEKVCTVDVRDNSGLTPLHLACLQGDRIILECLLASIRHSRPWTTAADVEAPITNPILCQDNIGNTCLHTAFLEHVGRFLFLHLHIYFCFFVINNGTWGTLDHSPSGSQSVIYRSMSVVLVSSTLKVRLTGNQKV
ncbi:unnamed protein product [Dibothriocephalus latus]|uniref:Uncharacterized protein n=1 Tax=Dibothriocephalus latus TaxID=60516 RepID=A0A3P7Q0R5_DIBLA|nr:unnamed protein product [Dibothriocephalus latus]